MNEKKVNILLVEDEETHAEIIRRAFKDQNSPAVLRVVKSLEDARTAITENPPQLVLLDLLLPDGSGLDFLLSAGKNNEYPFIVITAHGDEAKAVQAMKAGALDYVVKFKETLADMPHICKRSIREWKNIIGRRKTEEELKQYHEQLEKIVEERTQEISRAIKFKENIISTIPSVIVVLNTKLEIVTVNKRFYEVFNIKKTDVIGLNFCKIIECEDYNAKRKCKLQINIKNIYINRQKSIESEEIVKRKDGNKILKVYISRISNEKEEEILMVIEDITKTRLLENQLVQSERLAAADRLAASIAHEINNPLQSIITHLDLMKNGLPGDSKKFKNYNYVKSNIKRIGEIVGQLLDIYRSSDKVKTKVDINSLIHKVIELIDNQRQIKDIGLKLNLEKKLPYIYGWRINYIK